MQRATSETHTPDVYALAASELYTCAANAAQAAPSVRRRYWLQLRDAAAVLWERHRQPSKRLCVDADRTRELAERGVRVSATLCFAACRNAEGLLAREERLALGVLRAREELREPISGPCASA